MDSVSPETRSRVMAQVRSQRNRSTEWRVRAVSDPGWHSGLELESTRFAASPILFFEQNGSPCLWMAASGTVAQDATEGRRQTLSIGMRRWHGIALGMRRSQLIEASGLAGIEDLGAPAFHHGSRGRTDKGSLRIELVGCSTQSFSAQVGPGARCPIDKNEGVVKSEVFLSGARAPLGPTPELGCEDQDSGT